MICLNPFYKEIGFLTTLKSFERFSSCLENRTDADTDSRLFLLFEGWILDILAFIGSIFRANGFAHLLDAMAKRCGE
jgi:hypothetical protein